MSATLKLGLMGYGFAGATFHAPAISHCGRASVAVIATSQAERARADYPQARIVDDFDALLACDDINCVVIATPNITHFDLAQRALTAGKHVVVDKPVTLTAAEAQTLLQLAAQRGRLFAPFHNRRWDGDFMTLRALLASGQLGRITHYESHFDRFRPSVPQRWREQAAHAGGLLFDLGPHLIDQALALFGTPQSVFATLRMQRQNSEVPDYVHLQLSYPTHEVILHASALTALVAPRFTVHGEHGSYISDQLDTQEDQLKAGLRPGQPDYGQNLPGQLRTGNAEHQSDTVWPTLDGDYPGFYRALAECLLDGKAFPIPPQDAVDVMHIVELAQRSDAEGRRLPFQRILDAGKD
jgi:scyllo-inositol 2-dehydrogenase (NADP+)